MFSICEIKEETSSYYSKKEKNLRKWVVQHQEATRYFICIFNISAADFQ